MRRQGQHSPSASVFAALRCFSTCRAKGGLRAHSRLLRQLPAEPPAPTFGSESLVPRPVRTLRQLPQHCFGSSRAAPACSPSAKRTSAAGVTHRCSGVCASRGEFCPSVRRVLPRLLRRRRQLMGSRAVLLSHRRPSADKKTDSPVLPPIVAPATMTLW